MANRLSLVKTAVVRVDRATAWEYLTDKDKMGIWYHPATKELEVGADYILLDDFGGETHCWGKVLEIDPLNRLVCTFGTKPFGNDISKVTWELEPVNDNATLITFTHSGIADAVDGDPIERIAKLDWSWEAHYDRLRKATSA